MGEYLCWGSEWGLLAKVQGKFTGAFEVTCIFTGAVIMFTSLLSLKVAVRSGQKGELVIEVNLIILERLVTCGHLGLTARLWGVAIEAAGTKEEGIMKFSNLQYRVGKRVGENVKDRERLKGAQ